MVVVSTPNTSEISVGDVEDWLEGFGIKEGSHIETLIFDLMCVVDELEEALLIGQGEELICQVHLEGRKPTICPICALVMARNKDGGKRR